MNNTLRTLSQIITPKYQQMNLEQLADVYTKDLNPSVLASAFSKTFKLIINISQKFFGFSQADIASYSLETLDKCLQTYIPGEAVFTTYFTKIFSNRLREESQKLNTHKRKACFMSDSLEGLMENGYDVATSNENDSCDLTGFNLDERELTYCNLLLDGYTNAEISKKLNTSIMTLSNIRKKLRIKLATTI